jgi:hypothetical protein
VPGACLGAAPADIATGAVELIEDDSCFGAIMTITVAGGRDYATF